ncbi:hypothetical protein PAPYR_5901 [Paratrimastix pyriformis]|uniref:Uncharacterized protein n=1 Tax=Paratrimastix pyriformis TaxID=342808 RepID=A0ABQ8UNQ4_9EUKA|nr:hypothetical protein PAPYR_5901 [Paratrimastix pyriformis]
MELLNEKRQREKREDAERLEATLKRDQEERERAAEAEARRREHDRGFQRAWNDQMADRVRREEQWKEHERAFEVTKKHHTPADPEPRALFVGQIHFFLSNQNFNQKKHHSPADPDPRRGP